MSRINDLLDEATARVPQRPGDLEAVRSRARRRQQRQRGTGALLAVALAAAVTVSLLTDGRPDVPVIGADPTAQVLQLRFCPVALCDTMPMSPDEAVAALADDPEVLTLRIVTAEEVRDTAAVEQGWDRDDLPLHGFAPVLEIELRGDEPLLDVAQRFDAAVPGISIVTGRLAEAASAPLGAEGRFDERAILGERSVVATHETVTLRAWQVRGGGVCFAVGGLSSCHGHGLVRGLSRETSGWGRIDLATPTHCVWGQAGPDASSVRVTWANGHETEAALGLAPRTVLGHGFLTCVDTDTYPVAIASQAPDSDVEMGASPGASVVEEVRREGGAPRRDLIRELGDRLDSAGVADAIAALPAAGTDRRDGAVAILRRALEEAPVPSGFDDLVISEIGVEASRDDGRVHVFGAVAARGATDPPLCLGVSVDLEDPDRHGVLLRDLVWTEGACSSPLDR